MDAPFGRLGGTLESLARSGFIDWFQLKPTGEASGPGTVIYRPSGPAFHDLVTLSAEAPTGALRRLDLQVARSFIDDARQGMFARGIIKSFVEAVAASPATAVLAEEIMFRDVPGPVLMRGEPPPVGSKPSPAFLTVVGSTDRAEIKEGPLTLVFVNTALPTRGLTISVGFH